MAKKPKMTQAEYARYRGVSKVAVGRAIKSGRLAASVVVEGRSRRILVDLADREWSERTDLARAAVPTEAGAAPQSKAAIDIRDAKLRRELAAAERAELDLGKRRGELVLADDVSRAVADAFAQVRTRLLSVPSRAKQRRPGLSVDDVLVIEELIREALEELADAGQIGS